MCLYFDPTTQKEQIKQLFGRKQSITVFKCFEVGTNRPEAIYAPFRGVRAKTKRGFYISNRKSKDIKKSEIIPYYDTKGKIFYGIHVHLDDIISVGSGITVKATAYKKDLVAISNASTEAVFMKIKLPTDVVRKYHTNIKPKRIK